MWIISLICSIIGIICYFNGINFFIIISAILVIIDNILNIFFGRQKNIAFLLVTIFVGILFSLIFHHSILYFTCLFICSVDIIEGVLGILILIIGLITENIINRSEKENYIKLLNLLKNELGIENLDEIIAKIYDFYANKEIDIPFIDLKDKNEYQKLEYLEQIFETAIGTKNVDETIQKLENFYNNQANELNEFIEHTNNNDYKSVTNVIDKNIKKNEHLIENSWEAKHPPCPYCGHKNSYKKEYCFMCGKKIK